MVHFLTIIGRKGCNLNNGKIFLAIFTCLFFVQFFFSFKIAHSYDDVITVSNTPYLSVPDAPDENNCGPWVEDIISTDLPEIPEEAIVLSVDVSFTVSHIYTIDLVVILQYDDDTNKVELLADMTGFNNPFTKTNIESFYNCKAKTYWKLRLKDCIPTGDGQLVTWSLTVRYHVPPDPPTDVWAYTGFGPREIDLHWTPVYDIQCSGYRIEGNRDDDTLTKHNVTEVERSVFDCNTNFKTIDLLPCADSHYFRIRTISTYSALGRPSWPLVRVLSSYCQNVDVFGSLKYVTYDDVSAGYTYDADTVCLPNALVTVWDGVTGDSFAVPPIYTDILFGIFFTTLAYVNHPIYFRFQLVNQSESLRVFDFDSASVIYTFSDTLGPDNSFEEIKDQAWPPDTIFAKASYSWDYLQDTRKFFQQFSSWDTPLPVQVWYDYNNFTDIASSEFDDLNQRYLIYLTSRINPFMYRMEQPIHEYAHLIHLKTWDIDSLHRPECPSIHYPDSPTSGYCALVEGWAEFLSCVPYSISGDRKAKYLKHSGQDLEYNDWWSGSDGTNENGSFVEGAVASAWYDMEDLNIDYPDEWSGTEYYELGYEFAKIFDIFKSLKPQDMVEVMTYWQNDPNIEDWEKEHMIKIFSQHYIFKPGDANTDGNVSVSDVVFLINYLFKQGAAPDPYWVGDANGDCNVSVSDVVYLTVYLFQSGAEPIYNPDCW